MRIRALSLPCIALVVAAFAGIARAEDFRLRVDARYQSVAFRGVSLDSIPLSQAVIGDGGGLETPDGIAVRCPPGSSYCYFFRPGEEQRGGPLVTTADLAFWGFGVRGLSLHATSRFAGETGSADAWPGAEPAVQLLEGYLEYSDARVGARLGRLHEPTRLGFVGYDGGRLELRLVEGQVRGGAYAGWALARSSPLPSTSSVLNPLDDFQPRERQHLLGTDLRVAVGPAEATLLYQREVDPRADDFVSERAGADARWAGPAGLALSAGADYDLAAGWWGSAETRLSYSGSELVDAAAVGVRRYRPHFDLWTIWGAFSPSPYRAAFGELSVRPRRAVRLGVRGETYEYEEIRADAPLVRSEDEGWRWSGFADWAPAAKWTVTAGLHQEYGPGASSLGYQGGVTHSFGHSLVAFDGSYLKRPLEFRFDEAKVWTWGVRAAHDLRADLRLSADLRLVRETRDRPDAAAFDWDQARGSLGATWMLGSAAPERRVPPAILRIPQRQVRP